MSRLFGVVIISSLLAVSVSWPQDFSVKKFKVGIEYEHSLPMSGGSERYKHKNNLDPFYITVTANAKDGYVISYLQISTTTDSTGEVEFKVVRGQTGSRNIVFQLVSNQTEFLSYNYLAYGIREQEYKKLNNIITLQLRSSSQRIHYNYLIIFVFIFVNLRYFLI